MVSKGIRLHLKRRICTKWSKNKLNIIPINLANPVHYGESFCHSSCVLTYIVCCHAEFFELVDMKWEVP